jgi:hypothetical protein
MKKTCINVDGNGRRCLFWDSDSCLGDMLPKVIRQKILKEILSERDRQDKKWGEQNHPMGTSRKYLVRAEAAKMKCDQNAKCGVVTWRDILDEEVQEAFAEEDPGTLRGELIQVAAVTMAMIECIDRNSIRRKYHEEKNTQEESSKMPDCI